MKTGSRTPLKLSEHIDFFFFKYGFQKVSLKTARFLRLWNAPLHFCPGTEQLQLTVRRAAGHQAGVPTGFKQTSMCLTICGMAAGLQVWRTYCNIVRSNERHPPVDQKSVIKECGILMWFDFFLIKQIASSEILILCLKKELDVYYS